jgi:hypothetical protein
MMLRWPLPLLALLAAVASAKGSVTQPCHLHVAATGAASLAHGESPSIAAAQSAVRAKLSANDSQLDEDLVVCLGPGVHSVGGVPLVFDAVDSPRGSRVIWRGSQGADPSVVSGGVQVTGWKAATLAGGPAFSAAVPAAVAGLATVRQLWVQGGRANRTAVETAEDCMIDCTIFNASNQNCAPGAAAPHNCPDVAPTCVGYLYDVHWGHCEHCECRSNNSLPVFRPWAMKPGGPGTAVTAVGFTTSTPLPESWAANGKNTKAIEFTWPIVIDNWIEPRCTIASIEGNNVTLSSPCGPHLYSRHADGVPPSPVRIEAAPPATALAPGEFWHDADKGLLYYQLAEGQTAEQLNSGAWIASEEVLLNYSGTSSHSWEGVHFQYSTWMQPNSGDGYVDNQATVFACTAGSDVCNLGTWGEPLGAVRVSGGKDLSFSGCEFSHIGSAYALSVLGSSKGVSVTGCTFSDLSGGFLKLGSVGKDNTGNDTSTWDEGFSVTHNVAHKQALEYGGAPGYFGAPRS